MDLRHIAAVRLEVLEPREVGLGHPQIGIQAEQQGDVDVDAFADQVADRRRPAIGAGHLDHQVLSIDRLPEPLGLADGLVGLQRQIGRDFEADVAVDAAGAVPHRLQLVGRVLDVLDRQPLVDVHGLGDAGGKGGLEAVVVVPALPDGLFEDRGIGGDAGDRVLLEQPLQLIAHELAVHVVEPDRLAGLGQLLQRIGHAVS